MLIRSEHCLSNRIMSLTVPLHVLLNRQLDQTEIHARQNLLFDLKDVITSKWGGAIMQPFGSYPVGLSIFLSDIDVSILGMGVDDDDSNQRRLSIECNRNIRVSEDMSERGGKSLMPIDLTGGANANANAHASSLEPARGGNAPSTTDSSRSKGNNNGSSSSSASKGGKQAEFVEVLENRGDEEEEVSWSLDTFALSKIAPVQSESMEGASTAHAEKEKVSSSIVDNVTRVSAPSTGTQIELEVGNSGSKMPANVSAGDVDTDAGVISYTVDNGAMSCDERFRLIQESLYSGKFKVQKLDGESEGSSERNDTDNAQDRALDDNEWDESDDKYYDTTSIHFNPTGMYHDQYDSDMETEVEHYARCVGYSGHKRVAAVTAKRLAREAAAAEAAKVAAGGTVGVANVSGAPCPPVDTAVTCDVKVCSTVDAVERSNAPPSVTLKTVEVKYLNEKSGVEEGVLGQDAFDDFDYDRPDDYEDEIDSDGSEGSSQYGGEDGYEDDEGSMLREEEDLFCQEHNGQSNRSSSGSAGGNGNSNRNSKKRKASSSVDLVPSFPPSSSSSSSSARKVTVTGNSRIAL